jgi:hypothetical protein
MPSVPAALIEVVGCCSETLVNAEQLYTGSAVFYLKKKDCTGLTFTCMSLLSPSTDVLD